MYVAVGSEGVTENDALSYHTFVRFTSKDSGLAASWETDIVELSAMHRLYTLRTLRPHQLQQREIQLLIAAVHERLATQLL